jgi:hypothetical protein
MSLAMQIVFGTLILTICALVHVAAFALLLPVLEKTNARMAQMRAITRHAVLMSVGVAATVAAHTIQIWLWAWAFYRFEAFSDFAACFYFALVTYTTVGYGDLVLGEGARIFGAFASVTGMLTFGISTAILVGLVLRILNLERRNRR